LFVETATDLGILSIQLYQINIDKLYKSQLQRLGTHRLEPVFTNTTLDWIENLQEPPMGPIAEKPFRVS